jgi:hypothetical protein
MERLTSYAHTREGTITQEAKRLYIAGPGLRYDDLESCF